MMHKYTAALRISGEHLDTDAVTKNLGLQPTHVVQVGEPQSRGPASKAVWSFELFSQSGGEWTSLEDALARVLSVFSSQRAAIKQLQREFDVYLWCGHFSSSFDGGPQLSAHLLKSLGDFGVQLYLDTYHSERD